MNANVQALDTMPWHKYLWPWLLMTIPALTVVAGVATFVLAQVTADGMVEDDYYKRGLAINEDKARDHKALDLELRAQAMIGEREVRVVLTSENSAEGAKLAENLVLRFRHATRGGIDQAVELRNEGGFYAGAIEPLAPGKWRLSLENTAEEWRLLGAFNPANADTVNLLPSIPVGDANSMAPADD